MHVYYATIEIVSVHGQFPPETEVQAERVVNCGGLYSDRLARLGGQVTSTQIVPFRGEYFELTPEARHLCRHLVYPVPDPGFPFLGVHLTKQVDGTVIAGPNAVLSLAREQYRRAAFSPRDAAANGARRILPVCQRAS